MVPDSPLLPFLYAVSIRHDYSWLCGLGGEILGDQTMVDGRDSHKRLVAGNPGQCDERCKMQSKRGLNEQFQFNLRK